MGNAVIMVGKQAKLAAVERNLLEFKKRKGLAAVVVARWAAKVRVASETVRAERMRRSGKELR